MEELMVDFSNWSTMAFTDFGFFIWSREGRFVPRFDEKLHGMPFGFIFLSIMRLRGECDESSWNSIVAVVVIMSVKECVWLFPLLSRR
jgi:hypothetical protein